MTGGISSVTVRLPLRIDLAGGWSDTPPICNDCGGCVLNAAVLLNGKLPVVAQVERLDVREVRVVSADLKKAGTLVRRSEIYGRQDPGDWCALVKSALCVTGYEFEEGGLSIRISADVPKGSGLGTSSILGAALVKALLTVREGRSPGWTRVSELTLELERKMETGGGWEDQMGALVPGVKLVTTAPGERQACRVRRLAPSAADEFSRFVDERCALYFTGQKRMARNVLQGVIGFYRRNPAGLATSVVETLKRDARASFAALQRGDFATFVAKVNAYWLNKKALDPGSTNPRVESIVARIAPFVDAVTLCGAGGGGFMFIVARDGAARHRLREILEKGSPVRGGCFYDLALA